MTEEEATEVVEYLWWLEDWQEQIKETQRTLKGWP